MAVTFLEAVFCYGIFMFLSTNCYQRLKLLRDTLRVFLSKCFIKTNTGLDSYTKLNWFMLVHQTGPANLETFPHIVGISLNTQSNV